MNAQELRQPPVLQSAYAAVVASEIAIITTLNTQIDRLGAVVGDHCGRHRDVEIYASLPGLGVILAARILGEFGDDPHRYLDAKARKNNAGTSPITRASGTKTVVLARYARNAASYGKNMSVDQTVRNDTNKARRGQPGRHALGPGHPAQLPRGMGSQEEGVAVQLGRLIRRSADPQVLVEPVTAETFRAAVVVGYLPMHPDGTILDALPDLWLFRATTLGSTAGSRWSRPVMITSRVCLSRPTSDMQDMPGALASVGQTA